MTSPKTNAEHLIASGVTSTEYLEIDKQLQERFKNTGVQEIYLTPGTTWSDHCIHEYLKGNQHTEGFAPYCQLNGVAYKMNRGTKVRDVFKSADLSGTISFFDVKIKAKLSDAKLVAEKSVEINNHFTNNIERIKEKIGEFIVSKERGTALSIFKGYERSDEEELRLKLMEMKGKGLKIGSMNGFVYIGLHTKAINDFITYTVKMAVRSYDEMSALLLLERIYRENPTIEEFAGNDYTKMRDDCRRNTTIQQGHIAYEVLHKILGWKTDKEITSSVMSHGGNNITYIPPSATFAYNWVWYNSDGTYSYYDHCYKLSQVIENGYWPYFVGRKMGLSIMECDDPIEFTKLVGLTNGLDAVPMGSRKNIHRSKQTTKSPYKPESILPETQTAAGISGNVVEGNVTWRGQGERHYKLIEGKYSETDPNTLLSTVYKYKGKCEFTRVTTWTNDFVQEFGPNIAGTMNVRDKLFLFDEDVVLIDMCSDSFNELLLWGAKKGLGIDSIIAGQDVDRLVVTVYRAVITDYLSDKDR